MRYNVVHPPTSGEIETRALDALRESGVLDLVVRAAEQEAPVPQDQDVSFRIRRTGHPSEGGMLISGSTDPGRRYMTVTTSRNPNEPATAEIVTA